MLLWSFTCVTQRTGPTAFRSHSKLVPFSWPLLDLIQVPFSCERSHIAPTSKRVAKCALAVKMSSRERNRVAECSASQNNSFLAMARDWDLSQVYTIARFLCHNDISKNTGIKIAHWLSRKGHAADVETAPVTRHVTSWTHSKHGWTSSN